MLPNPCRHLAAITLLGGRNDGDPSRVRQPESMGDCPADQVCACDCRAAPRPVLLAIARRCVSMSRMLAAGWRSCGRPSKSCSTSGNVRNPHHMHRPRGGLVAVAAVARGGVVGRGHASFLTVLIISLAALSLRDAGRLWRPRSLPSAPRSPRSACYCRRAAIRCAFNRTTPSRPCRMLHNRGCRGPST